MITIMKQVDNNLCSVSIFYFAELHRVDILRILLSIPNVYRQLGRDIRVFFLVCPL